MCCPVDAIAQFPPVVVVIMQSVVIDKRKISYVCVYPSRRHACCTILRRRRRVLSKDSVHVLFSPCHPLAIEDPESRLGEVDPCEWFLHLISVVLGI